MEVKNINTQTREELRLEGLNILCNGGTVEDVCEKTGLDKTYIYSACYANLESYKRRQDNKEKILKLIDEGLTREEIVSEIGVSFALYNKLIKELGVKPKRKKYTLTKSRKPTKPKYDYDAIKKYRSEGHTVKEVVEKFGCCEETVKHICKGVEVEIHNQWGSFEEREERVKAMVKRDLIGFDYVGGFTGSEGYIELRCQECGNTFERSLIQIRHIHRVTCPYCREKELTAKRIEKEKRAQEIKAEKERQRKVAKYKKITYKQQQMKECIVCGSLFMPNGNQKMCSLECRKRRINRNKDHRISKDKLIDNDITLEKLYARDDGVCHLCGGLCDWDDEPSRIGSKYPSIDHLITIADGGEHSWNNVKLAHWYCNTIRGNAPLSEWF